MVLVAGRVPAVHRAEIESIVRETGGRLIDGLPAIPWDVVDDDAEETLEGYGA